MIELRHFVPANARKVLVHYEDGDSRWIDEPVLQYRQHYLIIDGPRQEYVWSEWKSVPTVYEQEPAHER